MGFVSVQESLGDLGYDGIAFSHKDCGLEYVAFRPVQIKSALGNSGLFDPQSESLTDAIDEPECLYEPA